MKRVVPQLHLFCAALRQCVQVPPEHFASGVFFSRELVRNVSFICSGGVRVVAAQKTRGKTSNSAADAVCSHRDQGNAQLVHPSQTVQNIVSFFRVFRPLHSEEAVWPCLCGPVSGLCVEIVKILIKLITVGTNSNYVGEFSNLIGAFMFILPIWLISKKTERSKKGMATALAVSGVLRVAWACFCNACITLPMYAATMGISIDELTARFTPAMPQVQNLATFIILATIPFNVLKITLNYSLATILFFRVATAVPMLRRAEA